MRLVVIESPYAGEIEQNVTYAKEALLDALKRGEAPIASHLLFPGALDDNNPAERRLGMAAGLEWVRRADAMVVYADRGVSSGMKEAMDHAKRVGIPIEWRRIRGTQP